LEPLQLEQTDQNSIITIWKHSTRRWKWSLEQMCG